VTPGAVVQGPVVQPRWFCFAILAGAACVLLPALAQDRPSPPVASTVAGRTAAQWLQSIQQAAVRLNYQGVIVYQHGAEVRSSRVVHGFDGALSHERVLALDGRPREYIRRGDETQCLYPETRRVVIEQRGRHGAFPALTVAAPAEVLASYRLLTGAVDRVAGLPCQTLALEPVDLMRYGYRLCVDLASGLLIKAQTLGLQSEVIEQVAFTELRVDGVPDVAQLKASWSTAGWRVERANFQAADLESHGWHLTAPAGFMRHQDVQRSFAGTAQPALQSVLSDGLATVSVFIEPSSATSLPLEEDPRVQGPLSMISRRIGDSTVTVVGEVPPATVAAISRSVEYRRP
jgi:sigma-E factor negative regulatory protein RseB